jgi:single-stranded-DNA-specific exonuclease
MAELNLTGRSLDTADIGLQLAPKINAITRMSSLLKPIDLFFQSSAQDAKKFTSEILKLNAERKLLQEAGFQEVKTAYESFCQIESPDPLEHRQVFFYSSTSIHHGVTGLIASKMVEQFGGSFFIGSQSIETGVVVGSSRKSDAVSFSLVDLMSGSKSHWIRYGGHASAAGFEYQKDNQDLIFQSSKQFLEQLDLVSEIRPSSSANGNSNLNIIDLDWFDLNDHFYSWVQFLEPFGSHFPEPIFRLKKVPVLSFKVMKEKHFKLNLVNPHNRESLSFVLFFASEDQRQLINSLNRELDICFKIKRDNFNYNQRFQFIVESIQAIQFMQSGKMPV